jgi:hypothetical protein
VQQPLREAVALFTEAGRGAWATFANYWLITSMAQADGAARSGVLRQFVRLRRAADQMGGTAGPAKRPRCEC